MRGILLVIAAAVTAFALVLAGSFHFDDYSLFRDPAIASPDGWFEVWRLVQTRPLTWFTFWLNYQASGASPAPYHAVNLALHAAAATTLLLCLRRLVDERVALVAALLFAVHPFQTEPVAYVFARGTLLCTLLCLIALWLTLRRLDGWAVAAFGLALLAKEECAAFPLFLMALKLTDKPERRRFVPEFAMIALALAAGARVIWATTVVRGAGAAFGAGIGPVEYASYQGLALVRYLRMLVIPWGFSVDPELVASAGLRAMAWLVVAGAAIVALRWWRDRGPGFWFAAGLLLIAPSSSILPANDLAADRRMYLPMIAFSVFLSLLLARWRRWFGVVAIIALAGISMGYSWIWRSERSLWTEAVNRAPAKVRPKIWLSRAVSPAEALPLLEKAQKNTPEDDAVASEQGRVFLELGRPADALSAFGRALALKPGDADAVNNRGVALELLGQRDAAVQDFQRALAMDPCLFHARLNLKRQGVPAPPARCRFTPDQQRQLDR